MGILNDTDVIREDFLRNGFAVVRQLFGSEEVKALRDHYMALRHNGTYPDDLVGADIGSDDPLKRYPRMIHMHRWDKISRQWLLDGRIAAYLKLFLTDEPLAVQSMLYFKPPKARGQALHQDQFYLRAKPGTCMAAWLALDDCDTENGCMRAVSGSHNWSLLCPTPADTTQSFTDITVDLPPGESADPIPMTAGDVLFFNGTLVHGSYPNVSPDRFRRSLIGHYIESGAEQVAAFDQPVLRMDGSEYQIDESMHGGACGVWVEVDGKLSIEMRASSDQIAAHE